MFLTKLYKILPFCEGQILPKSNKNSTGRMFNANDVSAKSYVRHIRLRPRVVSFSLSTSCETRKKTARKNGRVKSPHEIPLAPGFARPLFVSRFSFASYTTD